MIGYWWTGETAGDERGVWGVGFRVLETGGDAKANR
jgi:hypothetical protein